MGWHVVHRPHLRHFDQATMLPSIIRTKQHQAQLQTPARNESPIAWPHDQGGNQRSRPRARRRRGTRSHAMHIHSSSPFDTRITHTYSDDLLRSPGNQKANPKYGPRTAPKTVPKAVPEPFRNRSRDAKKRSQNKTAERSGCGAPWRALPIVKIITAVAQDRNAVSF